ncbi:unnamed protein product [Macrosiphum euphorbiae]|uniref:Uncharacterized protein n=1 Tax=Macrosiphum euphorbiae TaxID=13131 RepID=A0AAV0VR65_9HEMI|nr:unnamed protein product [Macrosiphum euphorbiae]
MTIGRLVVGAEQMCLRMYAQAVTANPSSNWHRKVRPLVRPSRQPTTHAKYRTTTSGYLYTTPPPLLYIVAISLHADDTVVNRLIRGIGAVEIAKHTSATRIGG